MSSVVEDFSSGVESRVVGGEEQHSIWVPMSEAEAAAIQKKAQAENVNIRYLVANLLREWLASSELSDDDLERVAGGTGVSLPSLDFTGLMTKSQVLSKLPGRGETISTVMCAW